MHDPSPIGLPDEMDASGPSDAFIPAGLAALGIEADETELAIIGAVHQVFWGPIQGLLALDLGEVEPERNPDLSRAPR
jgi:hypothetical protein